VTAPPCRWCAGATDVVLDLGHQPAADHFPLPTDPLPDPAFSLRMVLCRGCGLAQLAEDATVPDEPRGVEPQALRNQAAAAVADLVGSGLLTPGQQVREFGSPHGGSWEQPLIEAGLSWRDGGHGAADVAIDVFGLMHAADQCAAFTRRVAAVDPGGVLLVQFHTLAAIVEEGQWNALRHGHVAYYSVPAITSMSADIGWAGVAVRTYPLYGGTVLLALRRGAAEADEVRALRETELAAGVRTASRVVTLGDAATGSARALTEFLEAERAAGRRVMGYGAASRAVALLTTARVEPELLAGVADASPAKQGRALPGSRVPVITPEALIAARPDRVLVLVPDLVVEVRAALPEIEATGGRWAVAEPRPALVPKNRSSS